jgi:hypothetical protein
MDIDQLYQLPLAEFTAARNAMLKHTSGAERAEVRKLAKPNAPAWLVNQLYWRRRKTYDRLIDASERLRTAHRQRIGGKAADVAAAEAAHAAALKSALDDVRTLAAAAGEALSPATLTSVNETLQALPSAAAAPGRLTRALRPAGFEALAGIVPGASVFAAAARAAAQQSTGRDASARHEPAGAGKAADRKDSVADGARAARERAAAKAADAARQRERAAIEKRLQEARAKEREADTALRQARAAEQKAAARVRQLTIDLEEARDAVSMSTAEAAKRQKAADAAAAKRGAIEDELAALAP